MATYPGSRLAGSASARADVHVTSATAAYTPAPPKPLANVGKVLVGVLLATVLAVWLTLLVQAERVRRACRAGV